MSSGVGDKSRKHCVTRAWCDQCKTDMQIKTPSDKEVLYCPCCKAKLVRESIDYV